jgi:hypothetical protein
MQKVLVSEGAPNDTVTIAFTGTSARVELPEPSLVKAYARKVRLVSWSDCFIKFGDSTVVAASTDTPFPAGVEVMNVPPAATNIAAIQRSSGNTLYITEVFTQE